MDYFIELLFSGLTRGAIYALIALGYTMVYGIIGLINFAHGEIYMIGAFTALIVATVLSLGVTALAIWRTGAHFDNAGMHATRRQLAKLGIGDEDDDAPTQQDAPK